MEDGGRIAAWTKAKIVQHSRRSSIKRHHGLVAIGTLGAAFKVIHKPLSTASGRIHMHCRVCGRHHILNRFVCEPYHAIEVAAWSVVRGSWTRALSTLE